MKNRQTARTHRMGSFGTLFDLLAKRSPVIHAAIAAVLTLLGYYATNAYLISGYESERNLLRNEVSAIIARNRQAEAVMSNEKQYHQEYATAFRISEDARQMLPTKEEISAVMEGVKDLAGRTGLKVTRFSAQQTPVASTFASSATQPSSAAPPSNAPAPQPPLQGPQPAAPVPSPAAQPPSPPNKLFEVSVKLQVRGTHEAVMKFFASLATHERIIQIKTFAITSSGRDEVTDLELSTYFSPPPDNLPPIPDEVKKLAATL